MVVPVLSFNVALHRGNASFSGPNVSLSTVYLTFYGNDMRVRGVWDSSSNLIAGKLDSATWVRNVC